MRNVRCDNLEPHVSHTWGIEYADMGTMWLECDGRWSPHPEDEDR